MSFFLRSRSRVLLLDYDGTLIGSSSISSEPTPEVRAPLGSAEHTACCMRASKTSTPLAHTQNRCARRRLVLPSRCCFAYTHYSHTHTNLYKLQAMTVLRALTADPANQVWVVSGRARKELAAFFGDLVSDLI